MAKVAYRLLPCDDEGRPRESSRYTSIHDQNEAIGIGSVIEADLGGYRRWEVVEGRSDTTGLIGVRGKDRSDIPLAGTLVCRRLREGASSPAH